MKSSYADPKCARSLLRELFPKSIAVMPEIGDGQWEFVKTMNITGICTDFVNKWKSETYK
jgi:hypothetical protein